MSTEKNGKKVIIENSFRVKGIEAKIFEAINKVIIEAMCFEKKDLKEIIFEVINMSIEAKGFE